MSVLMYGAPSDLSDSPLVLAPESTGTSSGIVDFSVPSSPSLPGGTYPSPPGGAIAGANGAPEGTAEAQAHATKKTRRQTAFYPHTRATPERPRHTNPFARSAAKRESVLALGSIEHLQHYFTKTGLVNKTT